MNLADYSSFDGVALAELVSISPFSHECRLLLSSISVVILSSLQYHLTF